MCFLRGTFKPIEFSLLDTSGLEAFNIYTILWYASSSHMFPVPLRKQRVSVLFAECMNGMLQRWIHSKFRPITCLHLLLTFGLVDFAEVSPGSRLQCPWRHTVATACASFGSNGIQCLGVRIYSYLRTKLILSPRVNYTYRATTACRRS
jgi:hypothetical protein